MGWLGIEDEAFIRGNVPMTKQEVRILMLAKAHIAPNAVVYDIGAGTGSLSIEAARLAPKGHVFAIERKTEGISLLRANMEKFDVSNITPMQAEAPDGLVGLPAADAVLIGGSGGNLAAILDVVTTKLPLGGRVVVSAITMQSLIQAITYMRAHARTYHYEAFQVQINRLEQVGRYDMAKAINPIYILTGTKGEWV